MSVMDDLSRPKKPEDVQAEQHGKKSIASGEDPRLQRDYAFEFSFTNARGERFAGSFVNHILTLAQQAEVTHLRSRMIGGVPWVSLDEGSQGLFEMLCHMLVSLDREERPDWARELSGLTDIPLIEALYQEVAQHEAIFHGRRPAASSGAQDGDGTGG